MSKTVDERVVSMQFDNKNFESNVRTSISTLDKLKEKLNFSGAAKSFDNLNAATKKVDMSHLGGAVETVRARFSAMEVVGVTALANIANQAVNAGKRILSSLTIEPIKTGFNEYELKMDSVRTIMASTGEDIKVVNKYLEELNEYSDQTIYSFSDMTQNIGKFTNAGVKLEDAVMAIKGISNEAAVSGANANEASRAMYNFAQALSAGYVKLIDWKSIELANMATKEFKEQLIQTAVEAGTLSEAGDGLYKTLSGEVLGATYNFNESLQDQWMTTDVLVKTLRNYADAETDIGKKAFAAAQDVTKLSQMFDVLKETAQSGWSRTWEILFGDLEKAKAIFTPLTNFFSNIINKISDARNNLLEGVMNMTSPFSKLSDKLEKLNKAAKPTVKTLENLNEVADRVIRGDFGNQWDFGDANYRAKKLAEAGYDYAKVQNLVNEKLGVNVKLTEDSKEAQAELQKEQGKSIEQLLTMSDAQLEKTGFTKDEIKALRDLQTESKKTGKSIGELLEEMSKAPTGRDLLIQSFKNLGEAIKKPFDAIKEAWTNVFGSKDSNIEEKLYNIIVKIEEFTESLIMSDEAAENFKKVMEGVFAGMQIANMAIGGGFMAILKITSSVLSLFGTNLLEVGTYIADCIVRFRDWIKENTIFIGTYDKIAEVIFAVINGIKKCINTFKELSVVKDTIKKVKDYILGFFGDVDKGFKGFGINTIIDGITKAFDRLNKWIEGLEKSENIGEDIVKGLINGLKAGGKWIVDAMLNLGELIVNTIKNFLGIHSPSTVFMLIGGFILAGLVLGLMKGAPEVWEAIKSVGEGMLERFKAIDWKSIPGVVAEYIKKIDWGTVFAGALGVGMLFMAKRLLDIAEMFGKPIQQLGGMFDAVGGYFKALEAKVKGKTLDNTAKAILNIAIAIGILAASVYILTKVDPKDMWMAVGVIVVLAAVVGALAFAASKMSKIGDVNYGKITLAVIGISGALLIMAFVIEKLSKINAGSIITILKTMGIMVGGIAAVMWAFGTFVRGRFAQNIDKAGWMMIKMASALYVMTKVIKAITLLSDGEIKRGLIVIGILELLFMAVIKVSQYSGKHATKAGSMLLMMSGAFFVMVGVIKVISLLSGREIAKGLGVIILMGLIFAALVAVSHIAGDNATKAGGMLLMMSGALFIMTIVIQQLSKLDGKSLAKSLGVITALGVVFAALVAVTCLAGKHAMKAGIMLLMMSGALLILTAVLFLLKHMDPSGLGRALGVITVLELLFAGLIAVTYLAKDCQKTLITLIVAISLLIVAVVALTFVDPEKLKVSAASMTAVITAFGLVIAALGLIKDTSGINKTLATLLLVVGGLAGIIAALTMVDSPESLITTVTALSILMLSLAGTLVVMGYAGKTSTKAIGALALIGLVVAELALILGAMSYLGVEAAIPTVIALSSLLVVMSGVLIVLGAVGALGGTVFMGIGAIALLGLVVAELALILGVMNHLGVEASIPTVMALSALLVVMSGVLVVLGVVGAMGPMAFIGIGAIAVLGLVVAELALIIGVMNHLGIEASIPTAIALSVLLMAMSGSLVALGVAGTMGPAAFVGIGALATLIAGIGGLVIGIGALMNNVPMLEEFLNKGIVVIGKIGYAIGSFFGNIIAGFTGTALTILPTIGIMLSQFMTNLTPFIDGVKMVDGKVLKGVAIITAAIIALSIADVVNTWTTIMSFGGLPLLGLELSAFMIGAQDFIKIANTINPKTMEGVKTLAEAILILSGANLLEGVSRFLGFGEGSLTTFGSQLGSMGTGLANFVKSLGVFTEEQVTTVDCAARAIKALASAAKDIPNDGGWVGAIFGENSISTFGAKLPALGTHISTFVQNLGTFSDDQVRTVKCAGEAIKALAEAASDIPNDGGWVGAILGENSISTFGAKLPALGTHIKGFITNLTADGTFSEAQVNTVKCAGDAIKALAEAASDIPNEGGWASSIFGDNGLATFGSKLPQFGTDLSGFVAGLGTFTSDQVTTVSNAVNAINAFAKVGSSDMDVDKVSELGSKLKSFANKFGDFCEKMTKVDSDSISSATSKLKSMVEAAKSVTTVDAEAVKSFGESLKTLANTSVDDFVSAFTGDASTASIKDAAKTLLTNFITGAEDNLETVKTAFSDIASDSAKAIETKTIYLAFYSAGEYVVDGFADGITSRTFKAEAKATAMARAALRAAKEALDEHSPSKEFYKIGAFGGQGFVNALADYESKSFSAGARIAETAKNGLAKCVSKITDIINNEIDAQPTIRPVLDLSAVEAGVGSIGTMFGSRATLGVSANIGAITSSMSNRQNGNADVVSAINKLRKDLSNVGNTTNIIDGITYSDGTEVSDAIGTLVRAARIERRV